jgi:hypothetical protein
LVEKTEVPGENHRLPQVTDKLSHCIFWSERPYFNFKYFILQ